MNSNPFRRQAHPSIRTADERDRSVEGRVALDEGLSTADLQEPPLSTSAASGTKEPVRITSSLHSLDPLRLATEDHQVAFENPDTHYDLYNSTPYARPVRSGDKEKKEKGEAVNQFVQASSSWNEESSTNSRTEFDRSTRMRPGLKANLFGQTLAPMEEPNRSILTQAPFESTRGARASLDVDAFKNLLMTGKTTPTASNSTSAQWKPQSITLADNSSSTDTSSMSRHSVFETVHEIHSETPRTSYERSMSEEDDKAGLIPDRRNSTKVKPPPPRHKHGKAVPPKGPQVVSFSDFTPSISGTNSSFSTQSSAPMSPTSTSLQRRTSYLNKPLPPPPPRPSSRESASVQRDSISSRISIEFPAFEGSDAAPTRRLPPIPPLARRSSILRTDVATRSRSNTLASSISVPEESSIDYADGATEIPSTVDKKAPPPPPARRSGAGHLAQALSAYPTEAGSQPGLSRKPSLKSAPPPPLRIRSMSALSAPSPAISGMMPPPPMPTPISPPRPSSSSRSSLVEAFTSPSESRRTSTEMKRTSTDSQRIPSFASSMKEKEDAITEESVLEVETYNLAPDDYVQLERIVSVIPSPPDEGMETSQAPATLLEAGESHILDSEARSVDVLAEMEAFERELEELTRRSSLAA